MVGCALILSGCHRADPLAVPEVSEPFRYVASSDKFTDTTTFKAQREELRPPLVARTAFFCRTGDNGEFGNQPVAYFAIAMKNGQGEPVIPSRAQFRIDHYPPFDALWANDSDPDKGSFIVPYSRLLVGAVNPSELYNAAWASSMTPYLANPFAFPLVEPLNPDFDAVGKAGKEALDQAAAESRRLMIRLSTARGGETDIDINLEDPAIRGVLSRCGWKTGSSVPAHQTLSLEGLQAFSTDMLLFTNSARSCHEKHDSSECAVALDKLRELAAKGVCPVGELGRKVWGRCPSLPSGGRAVGT